MINKDSNPLYQARMSFIQEIYNEIDNVPHNSSFSMSMFYIIAKFGLQLPAKEEDLFTNDNQVNLEFTNKEFKVKIKEFLFKYFK